LTGRAVVQRVITDSAVLDVAAGGFRIVELAPGIDAADVIAAPTHLSLIECRAHINRAESCISVDRLPASTLGRDAEHNPRRPIMTASSVSVLAANSVACHDIETTARQLFNAECALHAARQSGVDAWIAAASNKLSDAIRNYMLALAQ
jgi:hypothetical protein